MVPSLPPFLRLASHPLRWRLLAELAGSDYRVRELTQMVGQPQNLVSYHLRLLRGGGLLTARRSSFDGRDTYYHLDVDRCARELAAVGATLHPALGLSSPTVPVVSRRVLFACTGNSARSPMAEALLRRRCAGKIEVTSAGSHPRPSMHAGTVRVMAEEFGIDMAGRHPRHLDTVAGRSFHYVITLCDKAREVCPRFEGARAVHWSIPDPAGDYLAVARVAEEIDTRVRHLLPVLARKEVGRG